MQILTNSKRLPRPALIFLAAIGWPAVLFLCSTILLASWTGIDLAFPALTGPVSGPGPVDGNSDASSWHAIMYAVGSGAFAILGPLQFVSPIRRRLPAVHRATGFVFLPFALTAGVAPLAILFAVPAWDPVADRAIPAVLGALVIGALVNAFRLVRRRKYLLHREWMMRGFAAGLALAAFRFGQDGMPSPMGLGDGLRPLMEYSWPAILVAAEFWVRVTRLRKSEIPEIWPP